VTSFKTAQRVSERVGNELERERYGWEAQLEAPSSAPANPPRLLAVLGDGCRVRQRVDTPDGTPPNQAEEAEFDNGWRECKAGVVASMLPGSFKKGEYRPPSTLVQSHVATMENIEEFGRRLKAEAERRGLREAREVVLVSDAGHGLPEMWKREFPGAEWVVDFYHVASRVAECAAELVTPGPKLAALRERWKGWLYNGEISRLLKRLRFHARRHADRPGELSELAEGSPGRILWTHVRYIEKYRDHMAYPEYRARGWPIGSGTVEAFAKRIGNRMKAASKRWIRNGAEGIATLIAERASGDGRWDQHWPDHVYGQPEMQPN